ncbi:hypothetical protein ALTERO38_20366 [Alteromonas sp. 38]|nr:hypothetical protein ALTER154_100169 [Alteromonas sp. 154]VXB07253.1 hypothetical protein ALTERO38_20366 [Alteromonas sp. 38]
MNISELIPHRLNSVLIILCLYESLCRHEHKLLYDGAAKQYKYDYILIII